MACHPPFSGINSPLSAESNHYPYAPDTGSTKTSSPSIHQKAGSLFQELSLNSLPSASAPYSETDAAEVGSSGRIITHVTVSTITPPLGFCHRGPDPPASGKNRQRWREYELWPLEKFTCTRRPWTRRSSAGLGAQPPMFCWEFLRCSLWRRN